MRRIAAALVGASLVGLLVWRWGADHVVASVPSGSSVQEVLRDAPGGSVVELLPGIHEGFEIEDKVSVVGREGALVRGPIVVRADGVRLAGLRVEGGDDGIRVHGADGVVIEDVVVWGAYLHGIEVANGSARIRDCVIGGLQSPYGQGFEIRNSNGRPRTTVERCSISSGQEGLVARVTRVEFRDNRIEGTSLRGITVTEMSEGLVERNEVVGVTGAGVYCGDMSHCEIRDNVVRGVAAADLSAGKSYAGHGILGFYHSTVRMKGNRFEALAAAEPVRLAYGTIETDRFPMSIWPQGWRGAIPGVGVAGASIAGLLGVTLAVRPLVRRWQRRPADREPTGIGERGLSALAVRVLIGGFLIQSFHMLEHLVQVFQVYVADAEIRSGLAGQRVDTEWVHFAYNTAVLAFLVWAWALLRPRGRMGAVAGESASFLLAGVLIQGYHQAEHVAKILQHVWTKVDPAPGLLGDNFGLVWFHFGINLAVYAGLAVVMVRLVTRLWPALRRSRPAAERLPQPAGA